MVSADRIFVCEFITGGGVPRPAGSLLAEGEAMLRALLRDLVELDGVQLVTARLAGLPAALPPGVKVVQVRDRCWETWRRVCRPGTALWPIAPESDGALARLSALGKRGGGVLGCDARALALASSKLRTARLLQQRGLPAVLTWPAERALKELPRATAWILKPDDGAGGTDLALFTTRPALQRRLRTMRRGRYVLQPYLRGTAASLSLLCEHGECRLLAVNRQHFHCRRRGGFLEQLVVGGLNARQPALKPLAQAVAAAVPGLWGLVGVDLVLTRSGPVILEINPRLTTAYAGLRESLEINPARLVLDLARGRGLPAELPAGRPVRVNPATPAPAAA